ncbi:MAG: DUF362 domain-containing protein [Candidatus Riflebacteria bacterium]|nr:DUF362 domain-containing protein [Candidatus Riflebacteria bacterium]
MATLTLGIKNLMGVLGGPRGEIHSPFKKLVDIVAEILPTLTIIDAYRILLRNGPQGGDPKDVKLTKTLIMSPCTVAADYTAVSLFDMKPLDIELLQEAVKRNLNKVALPVANLKKIVL